MHWRRSRRGISLRSNPEKMIPAPTTDVLAAPHIVSPVRLKLKWKAHERVSAESGK
jgi:hypothetical protein